MANEFIIRKGLIALEDSQITGSLSVTNSVTASFFTGSYRGDGSQLTGIEGFPFTGSAGITGSLTVVGPVNATTFTGDGSQLTGIEGFPFTGSAKITGSLEVTGSVTATSFTGSIQGIATSASYVQLANIDGFTAYSASVNTAIDSVLDATTPLTATVNTTNSPFTITSQSIVIIDSTNGDVTVNLPDLNAINGTPDQKPILLYKNDYSQNVIYVEPSGSQLVNGTTQDIIVSIQIAIAYNPTSAGWVTEGTSYQSLAELELFFVPRTETGSFATTGSNQFSGSQVITGSLTVTGDITGNITGSASTASYVEYTNVANKPALVSGSSQITYSGLTGIPSGIVSGSSQVTYSDLTSIPSGIVSGSAQIADFGIFATTGSNQFNGNQSITGSLTVSGQVVAQTLNVQQVTSSIVYSSGSNIFGNELSNTQQFTGSVGVTGSLTVAGQGYFGSTNYSNIIVDGTNATGWGNNIAFRSQGTDFGYLGSIGSLLGNTTKDMTIWATSGNGIRFYTNGNNLRATIDTSGNLGLGVTPQSVWQDAKALQIGSAAAPYLALFQQTTSTSDGYLGWNARLTGYRTFAYITTGDAVSLYRLNAGNHIWFNAPSGTAGNAISFTQAMTLDASGRLGIGNTSPQGLLQIGVNALTNNADASNAFNLKQTSTTAATGIYLERSGERRGYYMYIGGSLDSLIFQRNNAGTKADVMSLTRDGNVGISTDSPNERLQVSGAISATGTATTAFASSSTMDYFSGGTRFISRGGNNSTRGTYTFKLEAANGSLSINPLIITSGGLVGVGIEPSAWDTSVFPDTLQVGNGSISNNGGPFTQFANNIYYDGSNYRYISTGGAQRLIYNTDGTIVFENVASGTGGNTFTFSERMRITSGGNVGIGTDSPSARFQVNGNVRLYTTSGDGNELRGIFNVGGAADPLSFEMYKADAGTIGIYLTADGVSYFNGGNILIGATSSNGTKLQVSGNAFISGFTSNVLTNHAEKFIPLGGPGSAFSFDLASEFPSLSIAGNVLGVTMLLTIFGSGGSVYTAIATIARNSGGSWSSYALTTISSTASLLQSITGSGTTVTINTNSGSYVGVKVTAIIQ